MEFGGNRRNANSTKLGGHCSASTCIQQMHSDVSNHPARTPLRSAGLSARCASNGSPHQPSQFGSPLHIYLQIRLHLLFMIISSVDAARRSQMQFVETRSPDPKARNRSNEISIDPHPDSRNTQTHAHKLPKPRIKANTTDHTSTAEL